MAFSRSETLQYGNGKWKLTILGNGVAYEIRKKEGAGERVVFFQDDDALQFEATLDNYEEQFPETDISQILDWIWEHEQYDLIAETTKIYY